MKMKKKVFSKKMNKVIMASLFGILILTGCRRGNIVNEIYNDVRDGKEEIDFRDYTDFKWDKAFLFTSVHKREEVENAIHSKLKIDEEFLGPLIFLYQGKVVHQADNVIESFPDDEVARNKEQLQMKGAHSMLQNNTFYVFTPWNCTFRAVRQENTVFLTPK